MTVTGTEQRVYGTLVRRGDKFLIVRRQYPWSTIPDNTGYIELWTTKPELLKRVEIQFSSPNSNIYAICTSTSDFSIIYALMSDRILKIIDWKVVASVSLPSEAFYDTIQYNPISHEIIQISQQSKFYYIWDENLSLIGKYPNPCINDVSHNYIIGVDDHGMLVIVGTSGRINYYSYAFNYGEQNLFGSYITDPPFEKITIAPGDSYTITLPENIQKGFLHNLYVTPEGTPYLLNGWPEDESLINQSWRDAFPYTITNPITNETPITIEWNGCFVDKSGVWYRRMEDYAITPNPVTLPHASLWFNSNHTFSWPFNTTNIVYPDDVYTKRVIIGNVDNTPETFSQVITSSIQINKFNYVRGLFANTYVLNNNLILFTNSVYDISWYPTSRLTRPYGEETEYLSTLGIYPDDTVVDPTIISMNLTINEFVVVTVEYTIEKTKGWQIPITVFYIFTIYYPWNTIISAEPVSFINNKIKNKFICYNTRGNVVDVSLGDCTGIKLHRLTHEDPLPVIIP